MRRKTGQGRGGFVSSQVDEQGNVGCEEEEVVAVEEEEEVEVDAEVKAQR